MIYYYIIIFVLFSF